MLNTLAQLFRQWRRAGVPSRPIRMSSQSSVIWYGTPLVNDREIGTFQQRSQRPALKSDR